MLAMAGVGVALLDRLHAPSRRRRRSGDVAGRGDRGADAGDSCFSRPRRSWPNACSRSRMLLAVIAVERVDRREPARLRAPMRRRVSLQRRLCLIRTAGMAVDRGGSRLPGVAPTMAAGGDRARSRRPPCVLPWQLLRGGATRRPRPSSVAHGGTIAYSYRELLHDGAAWTIVERRPYRLARCARPGREQRRRHR